MFNSIALLSYAAATLAYLFLSCLLLIKRPVNNGLLSIACLTTSVWAGALTYHIVTASPLSLVVDLLELSRNAAWSVLMLSYLGPLQPRDQRSALTLKSSLGGFIALCVCFTIAAILSHITPSSAIAFEFGKIGPLVMSIIGMLLVEQIFRNTTDTQRWGIKFSCLGIGAMFAYDFYMYSDAMLFRHVNEGVWAARGLAVALTAPLIAIAVTRRGVGRSRIAVSRHFLFHSVTLVGSAVYLLAMAGAGYYLRFFGGRWGGVMQVAFLFGAMMLLAAVAFSGSFRSWLKVFISKHFYRYHYDYREEWIRFTKSLSENGHNLGEHAVQAIAELVHSTGGALWILRDSDKYEPAAHWNMFSSAEAEPSQSDLCLFLEQKQWIIDLQEHAQDPSKYDGLVLPSWLSALAKVWLIIPLMLHGKLFGFVVLAHPRSAIKLNWEVLDLLKIAGNQAASYLAQNESVKALMVARQFESFNRMSTFVVHDLKNVVSQLSLILSNAERHKDSVEFQQDMQETIAHSVDKMKLLLQKFSRQSPMEKPTQLYMDQLLERVVASKSAYRPRPILEIAQSGMAVFANAARLDRVVSHLVQNAVEATDKDGQVTVRLTKRDNHVLVEVQDTGQGMSEEFIEQRLFKPFESTKLVGMGIGVFEMREYVLELGGKVEVASRIGVGTTFTLTLPLYTSGISAVAAAA